MNYEIYCNGKLIATFENEQDRDDCLDYLQDKYEDCKFTTEAK